MKFLVDECLSPTYLAALAARGYGDAIHPTYGGFSGSPDHRIIERAVADDRLIITANARDYRRLLAAVAIHPGAIVVEPLTRVQTWQLVELALDFIERQINPMDYMVNRVVEVSVTAGVRPYVLPAPNLGA